MLFRVMVELAVGTDPAKFSTLNTPLQRSLPAARRAAAFICFDTGVLSPLPMRGAVLLRVVALKAVRCSRENYARLLVVVTLLLPLV